MNASVIQYLAARRLGVPTRYVRVGKARNSKRWHIWVGGTVVVATATTPANLIIEDERVEQVEPILRSVREQHARHMAHLRWERWRHTLCSTYGDDVSWPIGHAWSA